MKTLKIPMTVAAMSAAFIWQAQSEVFDPCRCPEHSASEELEIKRTNIVAESLLNLPNHLPDAFTVSVPVAGKKLTLKMEKNQVFGKNTRFLVADKTGTLQEVDLGPDRSYLGKVAERPDFVVSAVLTEKGLIANIIRPGQESITVKPLREIADGLLHEIAFGQAKDHQVCEHSDKGEVIASPLGAQANEVAASTGAITTVFATTAFAGGSSPASTATLPPTRVMDVLEYEVGVEIGSRAFFASTAYNGNLASAQASAQSIVGNLDARYLRGAGIKHRLGTVIIRTDAATDPLRNSVTGTGTSSTANSSLNAFRDYWNNNPQEVGSTHDLAVYHVLSAPSGLAWVNSVGTSNRYATSGGNGATSWADGTLVHEFGHSWSLSHVDESRGTYYESKPRNNSGSNAAGGSDVFVSVMHGGGSHNIGRLSTGEANQVYGVRENKRQFGDVVASPGAISPFGHRDEASTTGSPITIDVIANDYDANNDVLDVQILDTVSQQGGLITLSQGTGPGGRHELVYTPPVGHNGTDFFHYTVCDTTGRTDWGAVYVTNSGPAVVDLSLTAYFYDLGTSTSPIFTGNSDPYQRLSNITFGDLGFTSNGPNPVESRDREENGQISGVNDINRDHIRMKSPGAFHHKLASGLYDVLFTIGDATENSNSIRLTAEGGADVITTANHSTATFTNYVFQDLSVIDGELNIDIENLGFSSNITRIIITRVGVSVDTSLTSYSYDFGTDSSPVQSGWTAITPSITGDINWSGSTIDSRDRGPGSGVNDINRDFIQGSGSSTLNHVLADGLWSVTLNMGDSDFAHDLMGVRAEGQLISDSITSPAGQFSYVDENGASTTGTNFEVVVDDGQFNLEFFDNGGSDINWVVTRMSLTRIGDVPPQVTAPVVSVGGSSNITQTEADIAYSVVDDGGGTTSLTVYFGETDGGTTASNWANNQSLGTLNNGAYSVTLNGLSPGTAYYYTIYASNSAGEDWSSVSSFTTEAITNTPKLVRTTVSAVSSSSWTTVDLGQVYNSAVVIATPIYPNSSAPPVVTRIRNVAGSGFEVKIDRADSLTATVTMDVSIIAVEEGVYDQATHGVTMEAVKYTSTVTAGKNNWSAETRSYQNSYTNPVVVGQVMSAADSNWSVFWCQGSSRTEPPSSSDLSVGKHVAEDPNTTRSDETIGYVVIESGTGSLNGVTYTAGLGADSVRGTGNTSTGYNYTLTGLSSASAAAVSMAGMDGGDGGWAVLYGATPLTLTSLTLAVDEDALANSERKHTTEQVGYIVFE